MGACRVGCDSCGLYPIKGHRYKCQDCPDKVGFDLCGKCFDRGLHITGRFNQQHTPGTLLCISFITILSFSARITAIATRQASLQGALLICITYIVVHLWCCTSQSACACIRDALPQEPAYLCQAENAVVGCTADHKMGLVNPQPTVFHIFQVRTPPAALAWLQCFPC